MHTMRVGRTDDARQALQWSLHDYETNEPANRPGVLEARERWARFLLDHPRSEDDTAAAHADLKRVLADGAAASAYTVALARRTGSGAGGFERRTGGGRLGRTRARPNWSSRGSSPSTTCASQMI